MSIIGQMLLHYRILEPVGAGGMGEVYRALDTKLDREVAIKVLPVEFVRDSERVLRLKREAKMLAALNHPNVAAIYDLEEAEGTWFLVLEFIPGKTLAERIARGPLEFPEALIVFRQIAAALDCAHAKAITHRDLKPANVKITPDGQVKLLDFGLAKSIQPEDPSAAGTRTSATIPGEILGTTAYMSPEQARGHAVDKRTDIWSFGCVLYEALTGRRLFSGKTTSDVIAAILRDDPDLDRLPKSTPPSLVRLMRRCLRQDPAHRLRDIGDALLEIEEATVPQLGARPRTKRRFGLLIAGVAALLLAILWLATRLVTPGTRAVHFERLTDSVGMEEWPAIAPDSKFVAYVALSGKRRQIWVKLLAGGGAPLQLTREDIDREQPRWTPDSNALIYYTPSSTLGEQGTLWEIPALGGAPKRIASAFGGGDVSHDGQRVAVFQIHNGRVRLMVLARDGSQATLVKEFPAGEFYEMPRWSPDDRWIAFQGGGMMVYERTLYAIPAAGGQAREVARGNFLRGCSWLADGSGLVYSSSFGSTVAYPPVFNLRVVTRDGKNNRQVTFGDLSYLWPDIHASGKLVVTRVKTHANVWRFPVDGTAMENTQRAVQITRQTGQVQTPSVSHDGLEFVYLSDSGGYGNLWVAKTDGTNIRQLTFQRDTGTLVGLPVWSPVDNKIAFIQTRSGRTEQWLIQSDGSDLRQLTTGAAWGFWSGNGQWMYYGTLQEGNNCIVKIAVSGGKKTVVRCDNAISPAVSSDGSVLYFVSPVKQGGWNLDWEVRSESPESGPSQVIARIAGSRIPVERLSVHTIPSPDNKWLALPLSDHGTSNLWLVPVSGGPLRPLTDFGERPVLIARRVSWSPDGGHIYAAVAEMEADVILLDGLSM